MAVRAGQFITNGNGVVVDRLQTGGINSLNLNEALVYELGNRQSVTSTRDIPELSFSLESLDVSTEVEALLTNKAVTGIVAGTPYDLSAAYPLDIVTNLRKSKNSDNASRGIVVPYLVLESAQYTFGTKANATQTFGLRGDSCYVGPGASYQEEFTGNGTLTTFTLTNTAIKTVESGADTFALGVTIVNADGTFGRAFLGADFTNTSTAITFLTPPPAGSKIRVSYISATEAVYAQSVHQGVSVKPGAVRGPDIDLFVKPFGGSFTRYRGVQNFSASFKLSLEADEEFGNAHYVNQDYDVPTVDGSVTVRPNAVNDLVSVCQGLSATSSTEVVNALSTNPVDIEMRVRIPGTATIIKTIYIPQARFSFPPISARVQQKLDLSIQFKSDTGAMIVYAGPSGNT